MNQKMNQKIEIVRKQIEVMEALIEVLPRESYIKLYDILNDYSSESEAKRKIMEVFDFTYEQAECVYDMKLKEFSSLGYEELKTEYVELKKLYMSFMDTCNLEEKSECKEENSQCRDKHVPESDIVKKHRG